MRIAALSDIHSNVFALEAVIADLKQRDADVVVNLGDILYGPIAPRSTYDLLMENNFVTIRGNQDRQIYEATASEIESNPTLQFILNDLGQEPLDWMRGLPFDHQLTDNVYLCHGTPSNDLIYLLENVESGFAQLRSDKEIIALLNGQPADLILCGHTHTARVIHTSSNQLIVNPVSVGLPAYTDELPVVHSMQSFSHHASYAMLEQSAYSWTIQQNNVAYDYRKATNLAHQRGRKDSVHFLTTCRGL